ncbi:MAG: hypothetical protein IKU11_06225 [Clostridia bacterium]|nr:hypothetical protein [Clostridia bacterium]
MTPEEAFGRWTVIGEGSGKNNPRRWLCRCACGTEREVLERSLRYGRSQSCGCLRREKAEEALSYSCRNWGRKGRKPRIWAVEGAGPYGLIVYQL